MKTYTMEEYKKILIEKEEKVGYWKNIKFVCPRCKTPQTFNDFQKLGMEYDKIVSQLAFSCIGRHTKDKGCDWTLGGLFKIHEVEVIYKGIKRPRFDFYQEEASNDN